MQWISMCSHHESRKQLYLWDKLQSDEEKYQTTRSVEMQLRGVRKKSGLASELITRVVGQLE